MRTVLVTGGGGSGRTTVAAATALAAARCGRRVLLLGTGSPGGPEALFDGGAGPDGAEPDGGGAPRRVAPGLWLARTDSGAAFRARAVSLQERARSALDLLGAESLDDDELAEPPGVDALVLLGALRAAHAPAEPGGGPAYDLLVVDLPPAGQAVRTLALPELARRWLRRLLPPERQAARALRPVLAQLAGVPMPARSLYEGAERLDGELAAVQGVVESPKTSVRLVVEPGGAAVRALREARAGLALHGLAVDAVVVNRLLPDSSADPWLAELAARQRRTAALIAGECREETVPVCELPHLGREPEGLGDLEKLAELLPDGPEEDVGPRAGGTGADGPWVVEDRLAADGVLVWRLPLPGASRDSLTLVRRGDEVIVTTGPFRRALSLPAALRRCAVTGARLADGELSVRFEPEPGLWPARD
ncbi:ArsA family ATPase [Streptomyces sp. TRM43335]|uniref:ArsA family ATPase n=1 Tax=Streptomyces taklimakanensis TaxID=2569853 RepID=A0A6G2B982_9ACTN|nr:ArsA-related P-loop ATPase [Streptomyces taklimakanensis]MTE18686.1 ArsA family ATPase [Streptomyces taklimakanensis]